MTELFIKAELASSALVPAELHGMVCGMAVNGTPEFVVADLVALAGPDTLNDEEALGAFITEALDQLYDQEMSFVPLIPEDDEPLSVRVEGVVEWSGGFLAGFAAGLTASRDELPVDVQEIIRDFAGLSGMDASDYADQERFDLEDIEESEASLMEIYEYIRVSVVLIMALMDEHQAQEAAD
ncbi:MAG: hypothetical protein ACI883_000554 [Candidatus Azotimanducaceae bacterium]